MSKRKDLSLTEQVGVLIQLENKKSQTQIAREFGVSQSQVSRIAKRKAEILERFESNANPAKRRVRVGKYSMVESALLEWFKQALAKNSPVSSRLLFEKSYQLAEKLGVPNFVATKGWLSRWKERNNIVFKRLHCVAPQPRGQENPPDLSSSVDETWIKNVLPAIIGEYVPDCIYNCTETTFFYRALPATTHEIDATNCLSLLFCCNMAGTDKRPLVVFGGNTRPPCFAPLLTSHGKVHLPGNVCYFGASSMEAKRDIFATWLRDLDEFMQQMNKRILLFYDRSPVRPPSEQMRNVLHNVQLVYLPPKSTALLQPLDTGIIQTFKAFYRSHLFDRIMAALSFKTGSDAATIAKEITLLDAVHMMISAWDLVKPSTILSCFQKAKFISSDKDKSVASLLSGETSSSSSSAHTVKVPAGISEQDFNQYVCFDDYLIFPAGETEEDDYCDGPDAKTPGKVTSIKLEQTERFPEVRVPPSAPRALEACSVIREFLENSATEDFSDFYKVEKLVQDCVISRSSQQVSFKDFFLS